MHGYITRISDFFIFYSKISFHLSSFNSKPQERRGKKYELETAQRRIALTFQNIPCPLTAEFRVEIFKNEFTKFYGKHSFFSNIQAIAFVSKIFEETLDELIDSDVQKDFQETFFEKFIKPHHIEMISKELFRDLAGGHVTNGGKSRTTPLDINDPNIKDLIVAYNNGSWQDNEEKELVIQNMDPNEYPKCRGILLQLFQLREFQQLISFQQ